MSELIPGLLSGYYNMDRHLADTENTRANTQYNLGRLAMEQQNMEAEQAAAPWKLAQEQIGYAADKHALQKAYRDDDDDVKETTLREIAPLVKRYRGGGKRLEFQDALARRVEANRDRYQLTDEEVAELNSMSLEDWEDAIGGMQSIEDQAKSTATEQQADAYRGLAPDIGLSPDVAAGVDPATVNAWMTEQGRMQRHATASASSLQTGRNQTKSDVILQLAPLVASGEATEEQNALYNLLTGRDLAEARGAAQQEAALRAEYRLLFDQGGIMGMDPDAPPYPEWKAKRLEKMTGPSEDDPLGILQ